MSASESKAPQLVAVDFDPFAQGEVATMVPTTNGQREIWTAVQMEPVASLCFNESFSLRLRGPLDVERLRTAFRRVLERHASLRSTFTPDGLWLCTSDTLPASLSLVDLSTLSAAEQAQTMAERARLEVELPFNLVHGPLVRAQFFRLSSEEHVLFFTAHHIVCDGWSHWVVLTELAALYSGRALPEPDSFARYASEDSGGEKDEAYWLQRFANGAPSLDLPADRPRPRARTYDSAREDWVLPESLVEGLQKLGARHGASLVATFLAGYAAFLYRLTGQEDLVIGVPASGQARTGQNHLVGHCISLLPVRLAVAPEQPFTDLLRSVRTTFLDALDHQRPSFGRLLESLRLARDPGRIPLVSTVFNMDRSGEKLDFQGLEVSYASHPRRYETFELFINASFGTGQLVLTVQYNSNLFDAATVRRLCGHLEVLLQAIARDPDQSIARLPMLAEADRQQLLVEWNRTEADYPRDVPLAQLVEAQAERTPEAVAVVFGTESLSFAELNAQANQLAQALRAHGAGPDRLVGLCVERSLDMVVALLAVVKSGAAYLPLDPLLPPERLSYMLEDSGASLVLIQESLRASLPAFSGTVVSLDQTSWKSNPRDNLAVAVQPDNLAYVIYTSGSTGRPKGVEVPRGALTNLLWSMRQWLGLTTADRLLAVTTISFDIAGVDMWLPLLVGARLVVAGREDSADGEGLREQIDQHGITFLQATPVTWQLLLQAGWKGKSDLQIVCTGEAMPRDLAVELAPFVRRLWNLYGPTETTIWSTGYLVRDGNQPILIGRPVANTQCYILDGNGHPVPIGVVGELYIGGDGLARGYLGRPELTAEKFLPDPFRSQPGARLYRTGDLARYLPDGNIECLGRTDHQVKIRGLRIEPGEIEVVLAEHPGVHQAVLRVFEPKPGHLRLVAFYVPAPGAEVSATDLRKYLRGKLPDYMIPQQFVALESLPLTSSGKVDRKALALPAEAGTVAGERVAPHTPTERFLADLWANLTGSKAESIGANDNFFDVGGHSLLALQAIARIQTRTGVRLEARNMFLNSLGQIAEILAAAGVTGALQAQPELKPAAPPGSA